MNLHDDENGLAHAVNQQRTWHEIARSTSRNCGCDDKTQSLTVMDNLGDGVGGAVLGKL